MGKFSTYRYLELKDDSAPATSNSRSWPIKQPRRLRKVFVLLVVGALVVTYLLGLFAGQTRWMDGVAQKLGYESEPHHAVIIDAGSSGSRVLAYKFRVPFTVFGKAALELVDEYFEQTKPGLSFYADDPAKGAETIVQLIKNAGETVPVEKRASTPLLVRATAGLRLLPQEKADQIIKHVQDAISKLGYNVGPNAVEIMDGSDEGIFIWYTINLLHSRMGSQTMAALDLGGGSTQITYEVSGEESLPASGRYVVPAPDHNITVFTHSFLGLGLIAAKAGILRLENQNASDNRYTSVCVDPIVKDEKWMYDNQEYIVSGAPRPANQKRDVTFAKCLEMAKRHLQLKLDWEPKGPPKGSVAAMSFFYDVAADAGITDVNSGGTVTIAEYRSYAVAACSSANVEQPWSCLELCHIIALLQHGYKMPDTQTMSLFKKVNGHEVSWALGLAYTTTMGQLEAYHK